MNDATRPLPMTIFPASRFRLPCATALPRMERKDFFGASEDYHFPFFLPVGQMPAIATPSTSFESYSERGDEPPRGRRRYRETCGRKRRAGLMEEQRPETSESSPAARRRRMDLSQTRRPDLPPPSPSESWSRKRSPSPTRQQTQSLRDTGTPRVIIETENITTDDNTEARDL